MHKITETQPHNTIDDVTNVHEGVSCGTNSAESAHSFLLPTSAVLLTDIRQAGDDC